MWNNKQALSVIYTPLAFVFLCRLKTRLEMQKALEQDSTVYDYDAVYDDIQNQRMESNKKVLSGADRRVNSPILNPHVAGISVI